MEFSLNSALVDGSFASPLVLVTTVVVFLLLVLPWAGLAWRLSGPEWSRAGLVLTAAPAVLVLPLSPILFEVVATVIFNLGAKEHFAVCLMPTHFPIRDYGPAVLALLLAALVRWRRSRAKPGQQGVPTNGPVA
jgi:hypothetical protein